MTVEFQLAGKAHLVKIQRIQQAEKPRSLPITRPPPHWRQPFGSQA
jgi:hypothetical protein